MKTIKLMSIISVLLVFGACGAATEQSEGNKADGNEKTETAAATPADKNESTPEITATEDTPTKAIEEFAKAFAEKNLVRVKMRMSSKTLEVMAKGASAKGAKLDDTVTDFMNKTELPFKGVPETRNEKIDGTNATVEVSANGNWTPMPLVLENGKWRISFDKGKPAS